MIYCEPGAISGACRALFDQAQTSQGLFFSLPWLENLVEHGLAPTERLRLYALENRNETTSLALALCQSSRNTSWPIPARLYACANYYSSLTGPLVSGASAADPAQLALEVDLLVAAIATERRRRDTISMAPVDLGDPAVAAFILALRRHGFAVQVHETFVNRYLQVAGRDYAQYLASLPSQLRNTVQRKSRQLEKTGRSQLQLLTTPEEAERGIAAWTAVYAASWKQPEPHPHFMPGLIRLCAREGWLRLGVLSLDGQPIAAQIWIVVAGTASIYKLAYDESQARWSAGSVLTAHLMRYVIDIDRVREVDYLTGDDAYKRDWMPAWRQRHGVMAFNLRTLPGLLSAARHLGAAWARRKLRALAGRAKDR